MQGSVSLTKFIRRGEAIRASARMEFEASRTEHDPEIIARMLITARQCVLDMRHKVRSSWMM